MFTGVKVFSATKAKERDDLGEQVTRWPASSTAYRRCFANTSLWPRSS